MNYTDFFNDKTTLHCKNMNYLVIENCHLLIYIAAFNLLKCLKDCNLCEWGNIVSFWFCTFFSVLKEYSCLRFWHQGNTGLKLVSWSIYYISVSESICMRLQFFHHRVFDKTNQWSYLSMELSFWRGIQLNILFSS